MGVAQRNPLSVERLPQTEAALEYATRMHSGQVRDTDGAPFILHPREVAELLYGAGAADHLVAAGALHDVLEKTPATAFDLRRRFGSEIAGLVLAVTEDERIRRYAKRKAALRNQAAAAGQEALMLFAADKISKVHELRPACPSRLALRARRDRRRRLEHLRRSLELLTERLPASPLVDRLAVELAATQ
jgi:(p)ppGpp synthase/HD superfamily hydrolase